MNWLDDETLDLGQVSLELVTDPADYARTSTDTRFIMIKTRAMIERLIAQVGERRVRGLIDLGIFKGGSCVLYQHLFRPEKLVAIDVSPEPLAPLERYLLRAGLGQQVLTRYGVDQGNRRALDEIVARDLGATPLDLVVDDASHLLHATRESFNALFPRLTPGGLYVIEDWGWAHWPGEWQPGPPYFAAQPALSNLIVQIVFAAASRPEAIAEVLIDRVTVAVRRGPAALEPTFDIRTAHLARGRHWTPL